MNDPNSTNGIPDAHAFVVGQATGVNINESHMGATGAAMHHSSSMHNDDNVIKTKDSNYGNNFYKSYEPNKNNNIVILVFFIGIIIILGFVTLFVLNKDSLNNGFQENQLNKESIVTDKDYLYDKAIDFLKNKYHDLDTRKEQKDYQVLINYKKFGITADDTYNYAYMWVLSESYFVKREDLYQGRSNSSLYKIVFLNDEVVDYQMPSNGKGSENAEYSVMNKNYDFADTLKTICTNQEIYNSIMNYEVNLSNEKEIREHYSYVSDTTIYRENLGGGNGQSSSEVVPYPNDKAQGGSGFVPR